MNEIKDITDLRKLVSKGFNDWKTLGEVNVKENGNLLLFNYSAKAQYEDRWNPFELMCRGLILEKGTGKIVARPFDKFFNWNKDKHFTTSKINSVMEKMDGSLGIVYEYRGEWKVATRGSFDSEQAQWAQKKWNKLNYPIITGVTILIEIIYPTNRIVVDYCGAEKLVVLAMRQNYTGNYFSYDLIQNFIGEFPISFPKVYTNFKLPNDILKVLDSLAYNEEGYVVSFEDGSMFKFKGTEYLKLHKIISSFTFNNILDLHKSSSINEIKNILSDEFLEELDEWVDYIDQEILTMNETVEHYFINERPEGNRKDYALWAISKGKHISSFLFARIDNKDYLPMIYKYIKETAPYNMEIA